MTTRWSCIPLLIAALALFAGGARPITATVLAGEATWSNWYAVVDGVMGGRSTISHTITARGSLKATGNIVTQGGGFASIRSEVNWDLSGANAVAVTVVARRYDGLGDGARGITLQMLDRQTYYSFSHAFPAPVSATGGDTATYVLNLSDFEGEWRGSNCDSCIIDWSRVKQAVFMVAFQPGYFEFEVVSIEAVSTGSFPKNEWINPALSPLQLTSEEAIVDVLETAIAVGVPAFNKGYEPACTAVYMSAVKQVAYADGVAAAARNVLLKGIDDTLALSKTQPAFDRAWILRRAMDIVIMGAVQVYDAVSPGSVDVDVPIETSPSPEPSSPILSLLEIFHYSVNLIITTIN